jgi:integrase
MIAAPEPTGTAALAWPILQERARAYAEAARAPATLRAYATDWRAFSAWCAAHNVDALPASPQTVALFLADLPGRPATLRRKLAAIAVMHRAAGHEAPTAHGVVRATLAGICRERGVAPRPKTALLVGELRAALATCGDRHIDVRDRALLLIGFAGALRRSELDVDDVRFEAEGVVLRLRRSKTNQEGMLEEVAVLYGGIRTLARCAPSKRGSQLAGWAERAAVSGRRPRGAHRRRPIDGPHRRRTAEEDRRTRWPRPPELRRAFAA